jgi:hypothetical protein
VGVALDGKGVSVSVFHCVRVAVAGKDTGLHALEDRIRITTRMAVVIFWIFTFLFSFVG